MSDLDLTEAVEAAVKALFDLDLNTADSGFYGAAALTVAAPIIERQVRERIATGLSYLRELAHGNRVLLAAIDAITEPTPAPIPPTSEDRCEACGRILDCSGNCSKGCDR